MVSGVVVVVVVVVPVAAAAPAAAAAAVVDVVGFYDTFKHLRSSASLQT